MKLKLEKKTIKALSNEKQFAKQATHLVAGGTDCYSLGGSACPETQLNRVNGDDICYSFGNGACS